MSSDKNDLAKAFTFAAGSSAVAFLALLLNNHTEAALIALGISHFGSSQFSKLKKPWSYWLAGAFTGAAVCMAAISTREPPEETQRISHSSHIEMIEGHSPTSSL